MGFLVNPFASGGGLVIDSKHIFVNNTARDAYFDANPSEKVAGVLISVGSGYQEWDGTEWVDKTAIIAGRGRVSSVNGQTDVVVLTADNIDFNETQTTKEFVDGLNSRTTTNENNITTAQGNISTLQTNVGTNTSDINVAKSDISGLQSDVSGLRTDVNGNMINTSANTSMIHTLQDNQGKVKTDSTDTLQYLENKVDNTTVQVNGSKKLVAKSLDGLQATVIELNRLQGVQSNIQAQINALSNIGNFTGAVDTYADIDIEFPYPSDKDMVIVITDETKGDISTIYLYSETASDWQYSGTFTATVRDFLTDPINLETEITGVLDKSNIDSDIARQTDIPTTDINANTLARHNHSNKALLDSYTQSEADLSDAVTKKHEHSNKATLDTYNQTNANITDAVSKKHEHSNKATLDSYTQTEVNLSDAVSKKHEHTNKVTIDKFSENMGGQLLYNDQPIYTGDVPQLPDIEYGDAGKALVVNTNEDGYEYKEVASDWEDISGKPELYTQSEVNNLLDTKQDVLPEIGYGDAGKSLVINQTEDGYEYKTISGGVTDWDEITNKPIPEIEYGDNGKVLKANEFVGEYELVEITESDITDLDKYTQTEVNNLLDAKQDSLPEIAYGDDGKVLKSNESTGEYELSELTELDITDLDKYTQTEVNNLLDAKQDSLPEISYGDAGKFLRVNDYEDDFELSNEIKIEPLNEDPINPQTGRMWLYVAGNLTYNVTTGGAYDTYGAVGGSSAFWVLSKIVLTEGVEIESFGAHVAKVSNGSTFANNVWKDLNLRIYDDNEGVMGDLVSTKTIYTPTSDEKTDTLDIVQGDLVWREKTFDTSVYLNAGTYWFALVAGDGGPSDRDVVYRVGIYNKLNQGLVSRYWNGNTSAWFGDAESDKAAGIKWNYYLL